MPVINEEDDGNDHIYHTDFSQLLELPETSFSISDDALIGSTVATDSVQQTCPVHPYDSRFVDI